MESYWCHQTKDTNISKVSTHQNDSVLSLNFGKPLESKEVTSESEKMKLHLPN